MIDFNSPYVQEAVTGSNIENWETLNYKKILERLNSWIGISPCFLSSNITPSDDFKEYFSLCLLLAMSLDARKKQKTKDQHFFAEFLVKRIDYQMHTHQSGKPKQSNHKELFSKEFLYDLHDGSEIVEQLLRVNEGHFAKIVENNLGSPPNANKMSSSLLNRFKKGDIPNLTERMRIICATFFALQWKRLPIHKEVFESKNIEEINSILRKKSIPLGAEFTCYTQSTIKDLKIQCWGKEEVFTRLLGSSIAVLTLEEKISIPMGALVLLNLESMVEFFYDFHWTFVYLETGPDNYYAVNTTTIFVSPYNVILNLEKETHLLYPISRYLTIFFTKRGELPVGIKNTNIENFLSSKTSFTDGKDIFLLSSEEAEKREKSDINLALLMKKEAVRATLASRGIVATPLQINFIKNAHNWIFS